MKKLSRSKGIVLSIVAAGIVTFFMVNAVNNVGGPKVQMVLMTNTVKAGQAITASDIRTKEIPANFAVDAVTQVKDAVGKIAANELTPGHPLLKTDISSRPMREGLFVGEVGVRVPVDLVSSGGAMPGDYVDVLVSVGKQANGQSASMATLFRHKRVVAVFNAGGQKIESTTTASTAGGLAITPALENAPASVELALDSTQERDQLMSAGKVALSLSPWDDPQSQPAPSTGEQASTVGSPIPTPVTPQNK